MITLNSMCSPASSNEPPNSAWATYLSMSTSKPSIAPVNGLREPNSNVSAETPTSSLPRSTMSAIDDPAGMFPGAGNAPVGANERVAL